MSGRPTADARPETVSKPDAPPVLGLRASTYKGVRSVGLATYTARGISLVSLLIVARFLSPIDFGIASIALLIGSTLVSLSDFGLSSTLVSYGEAASPETFRRAARYRLLFSLGSFAVIFVAAGPISNILGAPQAEDAVRAMSFALLLGAAAFAPATGLASQRKFGALSWAYVALSVVQASVTIALAFYLHNYWAIVAGFLAGAATQTAAQWAMWKDRSWKGLEDAPGRTLLSVGGLVTVSWLSVATLFTLDRILISSMFGPQQLGYYALALSWGLYVADSLNLVVGTIALPTFAAMGGDRERVGSAYLAAVRMLAFIAIPASVGLVFIAPELLILILGAGTEKWLPSLAVLQILAFVGLLRSLVGPANSVLLSTKTFARHAYLIPIPIVVFVALALPFAGAAGSIVGVAAALLVAYIVSVFLTLRAITRVTQIGRWSVLSSIAGPAGAAAIMSAALLPLRLALPISFVSLGALLVVGVLAYVGAIILLGRRSDLNEFLDATRLILGRKRRKVSET